MLLETKVEAKESDTQRLRRRSRQPWHAVTITVPATACAASQACKGRRYLSAEAPLLPLAGCDVRRCECKYRHYDDRRGEPRRQEPRGNAEAVQKHGDRRGNRERRIQE